MFTLKEFLASEVKPALGCTEPGAVALAVARAWRETGHDAVRSVHVTVSGSIFKNGASVGIPGSGGLQGNAIAAALGVVCGNADLGLEALKPCNESSVAMARALLESGQVRVDADMSRFGVYILARLETTDHKAECLIEETHSSIIRVTLDGDVTYENITVGPDIHEEDDGPAVWDQVREMNFREILSKVREMDAEDVAYVLEGVKMNDEIAAFGLDPANDVGLELGKAMMRIASESTGPAAIAYRIKAVCSAASDARMVGATLPVMSSAGSGNHGITAILPVAEVGRATNRSEREIAEAITVSHLTTSFVKTRMGRLSPVCGCAVAAGAGAAAGIVRLLSRNGDDLETMEHAIALVISNLVGMVCDGAKQTCALKVGTAAMEGYHGAVMALEGHRLADAQGVVGRTIEDTVRNAAAINNDGMKDMDRTIIDIMAR